MHRYYSSTDKCWNFQGALDQEFEIILINIYLFIYLFTYLFIYLFIYKMCKAIESTV